MTDRIKSKIKTENNLNFLYSRWIKYEEDREEGAERWGKAHISSLSFHSLLNLRFCLESGNKAMH